jgi:hypothetical protein
MPSRSGTKSKHSGQTRSAGTSRQSKSTRETKSASTMDTQDLSQTCSSFPSSLPHRQPSRNHEVNHWNAAKDELYNEESNYQGLLHMTNTYYSPRSTMPSTSGTAAWDTALPMDDIILDPCSAFMTNESYGVSDLNGSSSHNSTSMFSILPVDPSLDLTYSQYSGAEGFNLGITSDNFTDDFAAGSTSYDSSDSAYMSPPISPTLQGDVWGASTDEYGCSGDYAIRRSMDYMHSHRSTQMQQESSPPSPPTSESDRYLASLSNPGYLLESKISKGSHMLTSGNSHSGSTNSLSHSTGSTGFETCARPSTFSTQSSSQGSRPAQRVLKPASERPREHGHESRLATSSSTTKPKEKPGAVQPRNHHLYKALPGKDGMYRCPFAKGTMCAHAPTKQKCGYE